MYEYVLWRWKWNGLVYRHRQKWLFYCFIDVSFVSWWNGWSTSSTTAQITHKGHSISCQLYIIIPFTLLSLAVFVTIRESLGMSDSDSLFIMSRAFAACIVPWELLFSKGNERVSRCALLLQCNFSESVSVFSYEPASWNQRRGVKLKYQKLAATRVLLLFQWHEWIQGNQVNDWWCWL